MDFSDKRFTFKPEIHKGKRIILICFEHEREIVSFLRGIKDIWWSDTHQKWYVYDNAHYRNIFNLHRGIAGESLLARVHEVNLQAAIGFEKKLLNGNYSKNTQRVYMTRFAKMLYVINDYPVDRLTPRQIRSYLLFCHKVLNMSDQEIHSSVTSIKKYFEKILKWEKVFLNMPRPQKKSSAGTTNGELIDKIKNGTFSIKHILLFKLCYIMGFSISEIVNLRVCDVNFSTSTIAVSSGIVRNKKVVPIPRNLQTHLKSHLKNEQPDTYLFETKKGVSCSVRNIQRIFKRMLQEAGWDEKIISHKPHTTYESRLITSGVDMKFYNYLIKLHSDSTSHTDNC